MRAEPDEAFVQAARIQEGVGRFVIRYCDWKETGSVAGFGQEAQMGEIIHRQRIDLPVRWCFAVERNSARKAFASAADDFGEVHAAGVLDQDVERRGVGLARDVERIGAETAVERANQLLIDVDLRIVVKAIETSLPPTPSSMPER